MIKPLTDYKEWAQRYGIQTKDAECPICKKLFPLNIPMAILGYRGLAMSDHGCGEGGPVRLVPVDADKLALWEELRPENCK